LKEIVKADEAMVQSAQIDLDRCRIRAPISGITGEIKIKKGNLIKANDDNPLVLINKIHPVYVKFSLPERELVNLKKFKEGGDVKVEAVVPGYENSKQVGKLYFIDNAVDNSTGTIQAKAIFDNTERVLWPGQYVDVVIILGIEPNAVVVPSQAVQTSQDGDFVFIVNSKNEVEAKKVKVSSKIGEEVVISEGVKVDELVVTDGQMQLVPGSKVKIKNIDVIKGE